MARNKENVTTQEVARTTTATPTTTAAVARPEFSFPVDIYDGDDVVVLVADLPGVAPNAVDIHFERGNLTIRGRVSPLMHQGDWVLEEYRVGDFVRTFSVSEDIDPSGIQAELKNGVLVLRLPKSEETKPRKIQVKGG